MLNKTLRATLIILLYACICFAVGYLYGAVLELLNVELTWWVIIPLIIVMFLGGIYVRKKVLG